MKYTAILFVVLLHLPIWAQRSSFSIRKSEIEKNMEQIYSVTEFQRIADSLQLSIDELFDYPIIFPIKHTQSISSYFGIRRHPSRKVWQFHTGIDIPQVKGTPVYSTGNGIVSRKGFESGYGYFIEIKHVGGFRSFYAHLSKTMVDVGDSVSITRQIACVGNTGISTGSHLHYEIRKGKRFLNPTEWCYCLFEILKGEF